MDNKMFVLEVGTLAVIAVIGYIALNVTTDSPTGELVAVEDEEVISALTDAEILEIYCLSAKKAISGGDTFFVTLSVNHVLDTCDFYLTPHDYESRQLCEEVILRTSMEGMIDCIPIKGLFCDTICSGVNTREE